MALLTQIGRKVLRRVRNYCHTDAKRIVIPTPRTLSFRRRESCHSEVENLVIPTPKGGGISFASKLGGSPRKLAITSAPASLPDLRLFPAAAVETKSRRESSANSSAAWRGDLPRPRNRP